MELMNWIWAAVALGSGLLIGELSGRLTRSALSRSSATALDPQLSHKFGKAVFWVWVLVGLVLAAGLLNPETLDEFGSKLVDEVPRLLLAGAWLIAGYAASVAAAAMVGQSALKATGVRQQALERALRAAIVAASVAAALNQAGVGSNIVALVVGVALAVPALTFVLLTVHGGRDVASQIAAGRALRHHLQLGRTITGSECTGRIVAIHSTSVEIEGIDGTTMFVPNARLLESGFEVVDRERSPLA